MKHRRAALFGAVTALFALSAGTVQAGPPNKPAEPAPVVCPKGHAVQASELPPVVPIAQCDLAGRVILDEGVGVAVPERGFQSEVFVDGGAEAGSFAVTTDPNGNVILSGVGDEPLASATEGEPLGPEPYLEPIDNTTPHYEYTSTYYVAAGDDTDTTLDNSDVTASGTGPGGSGDECIDTTRRILGFSESDTHKWFMNKSSIPGYFNVSNDNVLSRVREGGAHITNETTNCNNYHPDFDIHLSYQGDTPADTDMGWVNGEFVCWPSGNARDGQNTVAFGNTPQDAEGATCNYRHAYSSGELTESDIRINNDSTEVTFYATNSKPATCDNRVDLEGLVTHERGHTWGLDDIFGHPDLTMNGVSSGGCTRESRTLGLGDLYGLNDRY